MRDALVPAILLVLAATATAATSVCLPLDGHYRVGRYMPVKIDSPSAGVLTVSGQGFLPLSVNAADRPIAGTFPLLVLSPPGDQIDVGGEIVPLQLHLLGENDRLIGVADPVSDGEVQTLGKRLFPGRKLISAHLDRFAPPPSSAAAWEALDAIIFDTSSLPNWNSIRNLLAAGTCIAVRSGAAPAEEWPWQRDGNYWILRYEPVGPASPIVPDAYAAASSWTPGMPAPVRRLTTLGGILFCIIALLATLHRGRLGLMLLAAHVLVFAISTEKLGAMLQPLRRVEGVIRINDGRLSQGDVWSYHTVMKRGVETEGFGFLTRPALASAEQAQRVNLALKCEPDGRPIEFEATLSPQEKIAFVSRFVRPYEPGNEPRDRAPSSPLRALIADCYHAPGVRIVGETSEYSSDGFYLEYWPSIVLERTRD